MTTRCKARVLKVEKHEQGDPRYHSARIQLGSPPYDPNPESENGRFFSATPWIDMTIGVVNMAAAEMFKEGQDVFVDFTPVPTEE